MLVKFPSGVLIDQLLDQLLYPLLVQMGRGAPALSFELGVALPLHYIFTIDIKLFGTL